jgi:multidrug resistance efflux pump
VVLTLAVVTAAVGVQLTRAAVDVLVAPGARAGLGWLEPLADWSSFGLGARFSGTFEPRLATWLGGALAALGWLVLALVVVVVAHLATTRAQRRQRALTRRRRHLPLASKVLFAVVAVASLAELAGFGGHYLFSARYYVSTDNAMVDGDKIGINAPTTGVVSDWGIDQGSALRPHQVVGRIRSVGGGARPAWPVFAPGAGTVVVNDVVDGSYVRAGTELATAYDLAQIYATARVDATDIASVRPGELVEITADAFPGVDMTGVVDVVQGSTAGEFHPALADGALPGTAPAGVIQYIPVKITLLDTAGKALTPGMNISARIQRS